MNADEETSSVHGLAWVEDGKVRVRNPLPGGLPATITPCQQGEVLVSGKRICDAAEVREESVIEVRLPGKEPRVQISSEVSKSKLEAQVCVTLEDGYSAHLKDLPPANRLVLEVLHEPVPGRVEPDQVLLALESIGVTFGLDQDACRRACLQAGEKVTVARGQGPVPGKDGSIEFLVAMEAVVDLPLDAAKVDFRDVVKIPDVKAGQRIALKRDPVPGVPGRGVTGESILPPKTLDPKFKAGKGIEIQTEGACHHAVATLSGHPRFTRNTGTVSVEPLLSHRGDVDLSSGNLRFSGSLTITGSVLDGMKVECEGNQEIHGQVTGAKLKAWGSIRVGGNVFKSSVAAGIDSAAAMRADSLLGQVEALVSEVHGLEKQVRQRLIENLGDSRAGAVDLSSLASVNALVEQQYLSRVSAYLTRLYKDGAELLRSEIAARIRSTREFVIAPGPVFDRLYEIGQIVAEVRAWIKDELTKGESDVMLPYVQNSTVEASRDIIIAGQGAFYSTLTSGRSIKVRGTPGLIRGGEARAKELIEVNEAGGLGSAATVLGVTETGSITAGTLYANTVLSVGGFQIRTENTLYSVRAAVAGDELTVTSSSGVYRVR